MLESQLTTMYSACICTSQQHWKGRPASQTSSEATFLLSHRQECESDCPYTGSKKHQFACISLAVVHIDTSSVQVRVTCEFYSYDQFLCRSCFYPTRIKWTTANLY